MEHTKGEWTIETPCGFPYSGLYVVPVVRKDFPYHIAQIRQLRERKESEANACLIAAAPDLLEACKYSHTLLLRGIGQSTHAVALLEAAIAKVS